MTGPARLTGVQIGLAAAAAMAGLVVLLLRPSSGLLAYWLVPVLVAGINLVLAGIVTRRAPDNWCGPLMAFSGLTLVVLAASEIYFTAAAADPALPVSPYWIALSEGSWMLYYVPLALLMLYFPTGRLLTPRWRWVVVGLVAVPAIFAAAVAWSRRPHRTAVGRPRVVPGTLAGDVVAVAMLPLSWPASISGGRLSSDTGARLADVAAAVVAVAAPSRSPCSVRASYLALGRADLVVLGLAASPWPSRWRPRSRCCAAPGRRGRAAGPDHRVRVLAGVALAAIAVVSGLAGVLAARESVVVAVSVTVLT